MGKKNKGRPGLQVTTINLFPDDIEELKRLAAADDRPWQTFARRLIHERLEEMKAERISALPQPLPPKKKVIP